MTDGKKEALGRRLPDVPDKPEIDEDGEEVYWGFLGDVSGSPLYVTDGHLLLLASAIDPTVTTRRADEPGLRNNATAEKIGAFWAAAVARVDVAAELIGVAPEPPSNGQWQNALVRTGTGRVMVVDAHKLAFAVKAVRPDSLTVDAEIGAHIFTTHLALRRRGELVGAVMPVRLGARDFPFHNLHGEALSLADAVQA